MPHFLARALACSPEGSLGLAAAAVFAAVLAAWGPGRPFERLAWGGGALAAGALAGRASRRRPAAHGDEGALLDELPLILWTADELGQLGWLNARWREYAGQAPAEWTGAVHPDDAERVRGSFASGVGSGQPFELELRLRSRATGDHRWFAARACPRRRSDGAVSGWCGSFVDVDERRRREGALHEADRRKDEFLAVLGHELRNPLAAIRSALSVTAQRDATAEQAGAARRVVERQIGHMVRLIDDLLDVNRVIAGRMALHLALVDEAEALRAAAEARRTAALQRRQAPTVELPAEPVLASADRTRLEQVFVNLLNNAIKHSDQGSAIGVKLVREADRAVVSFRDEGMGIEPADLARVFEPFVQLDPARARADGGLGIGLTLVRHLVELHGGRVEATSAGRGRGSVFTVRLPVLPGHPTTEAAARRPLYRARTPVESRRILVVDDNMDSAQSLAVLLQIGGHEVLTARDGLDALSAAERFRPQVVLLDLGMPRMDGFEAARRLRSQPWARDVLLLALSGWSHDEDRVRAREAGFDEHLVKPLDPELLDEILSSRTRSRPRESAAPL